MGPQHNKGAESHVRAAMRAILAPLTGRSGGQQLAGQVLKNHGRRFAVELDQGSAVGGDRRNPVWPVRSSQQGAGAAVGAHLSELSLQRGVCLLYSASW